LTPKQVRFFKRLVLILEGEGHEVTVTARAYRETVELLKLEKMRFTVVGKYGGRRLEGKLEASLRRALELARFIAGLSPDMVVSHASPEAARVAFGLGIPHICVNDSPHAEAVARLTVPLCRRLLTPKIIPKKNWTRYGIESDAIVQYNAIDAAAWLHGISLDKGILGRLGLSGSRPIVVLRTEESFASYLLDRHPGHGSLVVPIVEELLSILGDGVDLVVLPRYESQISDVKRSVPEEVKVIEHAIDAPSLLAASSAFVGGGGTMTAEAALLGVPSISCYPGETTCVESFLIEKGLVEKISDPAEIARGVAEILGNLPSVRSSQEKRAYSVLARMDDPIEVIYGSILNVLGKGK